MAVDVSKIPNNSKFDPVREAILDLQSEIEDTGGSIGNGTLTVSTSGTLTGSGTFTANQSSNTTITIGIDDSTYLTSADISDFITLTDLSVTTSATPSGGGALSYDDTTGVFTFTPADAGTGLTLQQVTANGNSTTYGISTGNISVQPAGTGNGVVAISANSVGDAALTLTPGSTAGNGVIRTTIERGISFKPFNTEKVFIASDGNMNIYEKLAVGKTTAASTYHLEVDGTALANNFITSMTASGTTYTGTFSQYYNALQIRTATGGTISIGGSGPLSVQNNVAIKDGDLDVNGDVTADFFIGDGSQLTNISTSDTLQDVTDNGNTTTNSITVGGLESNGHLSILDTNSLYLFDENGAKINIDARGDGTGAMLHKWNRNSDNTAYLAYYENWYDGNSYHQIGVEADTWRIGTRGGDGVLYVGDLDASTNGALDSNKQGIVIQGTGGRVDAAQDGTERLPILQFFDSVPNYGSGTATAGELRGGVEWYSSETSSNLPAISGAIYSVNENTYNTQLGLGFYTNYNQTTPTEKLRIGGAGEVNIVSGDLQMGGTTVIDSSRIVYASSVRVTNIVTNRIVKFDGTDLDDSIMTDDGSSVSVAGDLSATGTISSNGNNVLTTATTFGGDVSGTYNNLQITNDSHTHDGRYYTEGETDTIVARSLGWIPAYSNTDENTVQWNDTEQAVRLYSGTDTTIGMAYKAIRMKAGDKVRVTVMVRSAFAATSGLYLRLYFYNGNLPDGKTHVSHSSGNSSAYVQEDSSGDVGWYENSAIGTSWQNFERTYTAPADGYMSLVILNWSGIGTGAIYVKQPDIQFEKVNQATSADLASDAQTLDGLNSTQFLRSDADDEATGFIVFDNNSGIRVESGGSTPDGTTGTYQQGVTLTGGNMRLNIDVSDVTNGGAYIQTRHQSSTYPNATYDLKLNPIGGDVEISNATILAKADGRVGINKSPTYQLDVAGQTYLDGNVYVANTNTASNAFYVMRTTATSQSLRIHVDDSAAVFTSIQDENTGLYGSFVFNMDSGATDPTFDVRYGSSTVARFRANGNSFLGTSGNLGVGTSNPENKVHIEQSTNDDLLLEIDNQNTGASSSAGLLLRGQGNNFYLRNWGDGTSLPNSTEFKSTAGGGNFRFNLGGNEIARMTGTGVPLQVNHNDSNPTLFIGRASGIASIKGGASGDGHVIIDSSNNSHGTFLQHYTSGNVYMATGGGKVGIGTTTVSEKLTISGGISLTGNINFGSSNGDIHLSRGSYISFYEDTSTNHSISSRNGAFSESDDIRINSYGSVLINLDSNNNNTSSANLSVGRHGSSGTISDWLFVVDGETGAGTFKGDVIAFGSPSDISLKENIKPIEGALDKVKRLQGVTFDWKQNDDDILKIKEDYGFIAQEVQEVLPELVRENENGKLSLRDKGIISILVEAVKEQQKQIDELKARLNA